MSRVSPAQPLSNAKPVSLLCLLVGARYSLTGYTQCMCIQRDHQVWVPVSNISEKATTVQKTLVELLLSDAVVTVTVQCSRVLRVVPDRRLAFWRLNTCSPVS